MRMIKQARKLFQKAYAGQSILVFENSEREVSGCALDFLC
jgi:hypothetical protein